ncbi:hypothetical protein PHISCL_08836 [Aspergillus sclerotialis]|uniref:Uncharacterized protein n=1 Tax=Aspergillus sclerotialis TaxID=2070753 RepID=A0A3A2ZLS5_9EURO|nr:hypothetical protein PHISCL_08836 [Aspergillus sclerotialis]
MRDWDHFVKNNVYFLRDRDTVTVGEEQPWTRGAVDGLPHLSALLASATLTPVSISGKEYELLAWGPQSSRRGWLCNPPLDAGQRQEQEHQVHPIHRNFWTVCGGIVEQFNTKPNSRWLCHNQILTVAATETSIGDMLDAYAWAWEDKGLTIPINADEYYVVAVEANMNVTLAHRKTGRVILFAPDTDSIGITILPGCPDRSLYTFDDAPDLETWIERSVLEQI